MSLEIIVQPTVEPVSLADVYNWLRLDVTGSPAAHPHDDQFEILIASARESVENDTRRSLVERTIEARVSSFARACFLRPPLIHVVSVQYYSTANVLTTLDSDTYFIETSGQIPLLALNDGYSWPSTFARSDAVVLTYIAGYEGTGSPVDNFTANVPKALRHAMLVLIQLEYDNLKPNEIDERRRTYDRLVARYRVPKV